MRTIVSRILLDALTVVTRVCCVRRIGHGLCEDGAEHLACGRLSTRVETRLRRYGSTGVRKDAAHTTKLPVRAESISSRQKRLLCGPLLPASQHCQARPLTSSSFSPPILPSNQSVTLTTRILSQLPPSATCSMT